MLTQLSLFVDNASAVELFPVAFDSLAAKPLWKPEESDLWLRGHLIKQIHKAADAQRRVLDDFQACGWQPSIPSPFSGKGAKERAKNTVASLNDRQNEPGIQFGNDGNGRIYWRERKKP